VLFVVIGIVLAYFDLELAFFGVHDKIYYMALVHMYTVILRTLLLFLSCIDLFIW